MVYCICLRWSLDMHIKGIGCDWVMSSGALSYETAVTPWSLGSLIVINDYEVNSVACALGALHLTCWLAIVSWLWLCLMSSFPYLGWGITSSGGQISWNVISSCLNLQYNWRSRLLPTKCSIKCPKGHFIKYLGWLIALSDNYSPYVDRRREIGPWVWK